MNCEIFIFLCFFPFFWEEKVADDDVKKEKKERKSEGGLGGNCFKRILLTLFCSNSKPAQLLKGKVS